MRKMCKCGHIRREHERASGIVPCLHFEKGDYGLNLSVCSCRNFNGVD